MLINYFEKSMNNIGYTLSLVIPLILLLMLPLFQKTDRENLVSVVGRIKNVEASYDKNIFKGYTLVVETREGEIELFVLKDLNVKKDVLTSLAGDRKVRFSYEKVFLDSDKKVIWELATDQKIVIEYDSVKGVYETFRKLILYAAIFIFVFCFGFGYMIDKGYVKMGKK